MQAPPQSMSTTTSSASSKRRRCDHCFQIHRPCERIAETIEQANEILRIANFPLKVQVGVQGGRRGGARNEEADEVAVDNESEFQLPPCLRCLKLGEKCVTSDRKRRVVTKKKNNGPGEQRSGLSGPKRRKVHGQPPQTQSQPHPQWPQSWRQDLTPSSTENTQLRHYHLLGSLRTHLISQAGLTFPSVFGSLNHDEAQGIFNRFLTAFWDSGLDVKVGNRKRKRRLHEIGDVEEEEEEGGGLESLEVGGPMGMGRLGELKVALYCGIGASCSTHSAILGDRVDRLASLNSSTHNDASQQPILPTPDLSSSDPHSLMIRRSCGTAREAAMRSIWDKCFEVWEASRSEFVDVVNEKKAEARIGKKTLGDGDKNFIDDGLMERLCIAMYMLVFSRKGDTTQGHELRKVMVQLIRKISFDLLPFLRQTMRDENGLFDNTPIMHYFELVTAADISIAVRTGQLPHTTQDDLCRIYAHPRIHPRIYYTIPIREGESPIPFGKNEDECLQIAWATTMALRRMTAICAFSVSTLPVLQCLPLLRNLISSFQARARYRLASFSQPSGPFPSPQEEPKIFKLWDVVHIAGPLLKLWSVVRQVEQKIQDLEELRSGDRNHEEFQKEWKGIKKDAWELMVESLDKLLDLFTDPSLSLDHSVRRAAILRFSNLSNGVKDLLQYVFDPTVEPLIALRRAGRIPPLHKTLQYLSFEGGIWLARLEELETALDEMNSRYRLPSPYYPSALKNTSVRDLRPTRTSPPLDSAIAQPSLCHPMAEGLPNTIAPSTRLQAPSASVTVSSKTGVHSSSKSTQDIRKKLVH